MKDEQPLKTARRQSRRADQNRCLICGRTVQIEQHHVAGRNHDPPLTAPLCQGHHEMVTENLRQADVAMRYEADPIARVRRALSAVAVFLHMLADGLWRYAELLKRTNHRPAGQKRNSK